MENHAADNSAARKKIVLIGFCWGMLRSNIKELLCKLM
jgi:hypothetical protein